MGAILEEYLDTLIAKEKGLGGVELHCSGPFFFSLSVMNFYQILDKHIFASGGVICFSS